jgi:hypothetical protein
MCIHIWAICMHHVDIKTIVVFFFTKRQPLPSLGVGAQAAGSKDHCLMKRLFRR